MGVRPEEPQVLNSKRTVRGHGRQREMGEEQGPWQPDLELGF